ILLINPGETTLTGTVFLRSSDVSYSNFDYSLPVRSGRASSIDGTDSLRTGMVRVVPAPGSESPDGSLVLSLRNGSITVSNVGISAARVGSRFHIYAESSQSVQTGIAIVNPSDNAIVVNVDLIAASGELYGSTTITVPAEGHAAMFTNEINGLPVLPNFE